MQVVAQDLVMCTMTARARRRVWQAPCATRARQSACLTSRSCRGNGLCRSVCLSVRAVSPPVPALCVPCSAPHPHQHQEAARFSSPSLSLQARESPSLSFFSLFPHLTLSPLYTPAIPLLLFFPPTGDVGRVLCSSPPKLSRWSLWRRTRPSPPSAVPGLWKWSTQGTASRGCVR